MTVYKIIRQ